MEKLGETGQHGRDGLKPLAAVRVGEGELAIQHILKVAELETGLRIARIEAAAMARQNPRLLILNASSCFEEFPIVNCTNFPFINLLN